MSALEWARWYEDGKSIDFLFGTLQFVVTYLRLRWTLLMCLSSLLLWVVANPHWSQTMSLGIWEGGTSALFRRFFDEGSSPSPTSALTSFLAFVVGLLPRPKPRFLWRLDSGILQDKRKGSIFGCHGECHFTVKFSRDRRRFPLQLSVQSDSCHWKWHSLALEIGLLIENHPKTNAAESFNDS